MSNAWRDLDLHLEVRGDVDPLAAPFPPASDITPAGVADIDYYPGNAATNTHVSIKATDPAGSLFGIHWTLAEPIPAGGFRLTFMWESVDETGLPADQLAMSARDADDTQMLYQTWDLRGQGYNDRQTLTFTGTADRDVAMIYLYARGNTDTGEWWLDGITADNGYVDVLGDTNTIKISRGSMDTGTLSATVLNARIDPTMTDGDALKPGSKIRATAINPDTGAREPIYTGRLRRSKIKWQTKGHKPDAVFWRTHPKASRIDLTVTDLLATLQNTPEARSIGSADRESSLDDLRYLMAAHPDIPFNINGSTATKSSADIAAENSGASLLDQVILARDTQGPPAAVWVGRDGALWGDDGLSGHDHPGRYNPDDDLGAFSLDGTMASELDADWDTDSLINQCDVTIRTGLDDKAQAVTVGPFSRPDSVAKWGPRKVTLSVNAVMNSVDYVNPGSYEYIGQIAASGVLQDDPSMRVHKVVVPLNDPTRYGHAFTDLERFWHVTVGHVDTYAYCDSIQHSIKPDGTWLVTYGFRAEQGIPPVLETDTMKKADVSGWQPLNLAPGYAWRAGYEGYVRRVGGMMMLKGQLDMNTGPWASYDTVASLPNGWTFPYQLNIYQQADPGQWMIYARAESGDLVTKGGPPTAHANIAAIGSAS